MVRPYHVAQNVEHLFTKDNNGTNILTVKFSLHFTQKYYAVSLFPFSDKWQVLHLKGAVTYGLANILYLCQQLQAY